MASVDLQAASLLEAEKARAAFTETHGRSAQKGCIYFNEKSYRGTSEDVDNLNARAQTFEFQLEFGAHRVFADRVDIIGAISTQASVDSRLYRLEVNELLQAVQERGITLHHCAIIYGFAPTVKPPADF